MATHAPPQSPKISADQRTTTSGFSGQVPAPTWQQLAASQANNLLATGVNTQYQIAVGLPSQGWAQQVNSQKGMPVRVGECSRCKSIVHAVVPNGNMPADYMCEPCKAAVKLSSNIKKRRDKQKKDTLPTAAALADMHSRLTGIEMKKKRCNECKRFGKAKCKIHSPLLKYETAETTDLRSQLLKDHFEREQRAQRRKSKTREEEEAEVVKDSFPATRPIRPVPINMMMLRNAGMVSESVTPSCLEAVSVLLSLNKQVGHMHS